MTEYLPSWSSIETCPKHGQYVESGYGCPRCEEESEEWRDPWWFKEPTSPPVQQIKLHGCELCGNLTCRGTCFK
jgi:hypothetical protein